MNNERVCVLLKIQCHRKVQQSVLRWLAV